MTRYDVNRLLQHVVVSGAVAMLVACSGSETKTEDPPRVDVRVLADEGPPLGNPREAVNPDVLLEGVKPN